MLHIFTFNERYQSIHGIKLTLHVYTKNKKRFFVCIFFFNKSANRNSWYTDKGSYI